jgi:hypothetical protein
MYPFVPHTHFHGQWETAVYSGSVNYPTGLPKILQSVLLRLVVLNSGSVVNTSQWVAIPLA